MNEVTENNNDTESEPTLQIAEYNTTAAALAELRSRYAGVVYDVTNAKGMAEAKAARREITKCRTSLDKIRKGIKAPALERCNLIDSEARGIKAQIVALEEPIDKQIKAEEKRIEDERQARIQAEEQRVEGIEGRINGMRTLLTEIQLLIVQESDRIKEQIKKVEAIDIDESFDEFEDQAGDTKSSVLSSLHELLTVAEGREKEAARIAKEREELDRLRREEEARKAEEKAETERKQAIKDEAERKAREKENERRAEEARKLKEEEDRINEEREKLEQDKRDEAAKKAAEEEAAKRAEEEAARAAEQAKFPGLPAIVRALSTYYGVPSKVAEKWIQDIRESSDD